MPFAAARAPAKAAEPATPKSQEPPGGWRPGTKVECKWKKSDNYFDAKIQRRQPDGTYSILWTKTNKVENDFEAWKIKPEGASQNELLAALGGFAPGQAMPAGGTAPKPFGANKPFGAPVSAQPAGGQMGFKASPAPAQHPMSMGRGAPVDNAQKWGNVNLTAANPYSMGAPVQFGAPNMGGGRGGPMGGPPKKHPLSMGGAPSGIGGVGQYTNQFAPGGQGGPAQPGPGQPGGLKPEDATEEQIHDIVMQRVAAKKRKDYDAADALRMQLKVLGVYVNDKAHEWYKHDGKFGSWGVPGPSGKTLQGEIKVIEEEVETENEDGTTTKTKKNQIGIVFEYLNQFGWLVKELKPEVVRQPFLRVGDYMIMVEGKMIAGNTPREAQIGIFKQYLKDGMKVRVKRDGYRMLFVGRIPIAIDGDAMGNGLLGEHFEKLGPVLEAKIFMGMNGTIRESKGCGMVKYKFPHCAELAISTMSKRSRIKGYDGGSSLVVEYSKNNEKEMAEKYKDRTPRPKPGSMPKDVRQQDKRAGRYTLGSAVLGPAVGGGPSGRGDVRFGNGPPTAANFDNGGRVVDLADSNTVDVRILDRARARRNQPAGMGGGGANLAENAWVKPGAAPAKYEGPVMDLSGDNARPGMTATIVKPTFVPKPARPTFLQQQGIKPARPRPVPTAPWMIVLKQKGFEHLIENFGRLGFTNPQAWGGLKDAELKLAGLKMGHIVKWKRLFGSKEAVGSSFEKADTDFWGTPSSAPKKVTAPPKDIRRTQDFRAKTNVAAVRKLPKNFMPPHMRRKAPGPAPSAWKMFKDPQGRPYYYNSVTKKTQWTRPDGFKPTPPS